METLARTPGPAKQLQMRILGLSDKLSDKTWIPWAPSWTGIQCLPEWDPSVAPGVPM